MRWVGIDTHKYYVHVTELREDGSKESYQIKLDEEGITNLKDRLGPDAHIVVEATFNSFSLYDELVPRVGRIVVAHPSQTHGASKLHLKNDKVSSEILARLLASDFVQEVWVPDKTLRGLRSLVEYRWALTNSRVATMGRIHALLDKEIVHLPSTRLMNKKGRCFLENMEWREPHSALAHDSMLRIYDATQRELDCVDAALRKWSQRSEEARLLMTIPGVGSVIAAFIMSQIGSINRFLNPKKLCAYAGIVPRVFCSGQTSRTGRITRAGRHLLRWALSLALPHVIRRPGPLREFHERLSLRRPKRVAHVACMRKLLTLIWHMLSSQQPYRYEDKELTIRKLKTADSLKTTKN